MPYIPHLKNQIKKTKCSGRCYIQNNKTVITLWIIPMKIVILLKPYVTLRYLVLCFLVVSRVTGFYPFETIVKAQDQTERLEGKIDLNNCLKYAFKHQPLIQQLQLRDEINRRNVDLALSDWLPQVDFTAGYQHYLKQPVSIFPDFTNPEGPKREVTTGVANTSSLQLNANQVIYNPEVLTAGRSAKFYRRQSQQSNHQSMINLVVGVSKAFYDVLLSQAKLDFYQEDLARTDKTLKDAHSMYESGLSDKIDYQRAEISMNNFNAEILGTREEIKAKYAWLKELIGYPSESPVEIASDSIKMAEDALLDTTEVVRYKNRIEYQLLLTNLSLAEISCGLLQTGIPAIALGICQL